MATYYGTSGNDNFTGTATGDTFSNIGEGVDTVTGLAGDDIVYMANTSSHGTVDGGEGIDSVYLASQVSGGTTFVNVENLEGGNITHMTGLLNLSDFENNNLTGSIQLWSLFDDVVQTVIGTQDDDSINSVLSQDTVYSGGGNDYVSVGTNATSAWVSGGDGNDTIQLANGLTHSRINGDDGIDTVIMGGTVNGGNTFSGVEILEGGNVIHLTGRLDLSDFETNNLTGSIQFWDSDGAFQEFIGTQDDDIISNLDDQDYVATLSGNDVINMSNENVHLAVALAGSGDDSIYVGTNAYVNLIDGAAGYDTVRFSTGLGHSNVFTDVEVMEGSNIAMVSGSTTNFSDFETNNLTGWFQLHYATQEDNFVGSQDADRITGVQELDEISSGSGNDIISFSDTNAYGNYIAAGDGNDTINLTSGLGGATVDGGAGNDTVTMGATTRGNIVFANVENMEGGFVDLNSNTTLDLSAFENNNLTGTIRITTTADGGTVIGTQDADVIQGFDARDTIFIGEGDSVYGGNNFDTLVYDDTIHEIFGGSGGSAGTLNLIGGGVVGEFSQFENFVTLADSGLTPGIGETAHRVFNDIGSVRHGETVTIDALANDEDLDGDNLTITSITAPANGTAVINPDGTVSYTANTDFAGVDTFSYTVVDEDGNTDTGLIKIGVVNDVVCFTRGTMIRTQNGLVAIENLTKGDLVETKDNGLQPIRWIGSKTVAAKGDVAPIKIKAGALNTTKDLLVSPQHCMLVQGWEAELMFGEAEILVPAKMLVNDHSVLRQEGGEVEYFHILFDSHELIEANGAWSESFHPGEVGFNALNEASRQEILTLFPHLASKGFESYGPSARMSARSFETGLIHASATFQPEMSEICGATAH